MTATAEWWHASEEPGKMLRWLLAEPDGRRRPSDRKLRLFSCAVCREAWHLLTDGRSRRAVERAERYADGEGADGMYAAWDDAWGADVGTSVDGGDRTAACLASHAAWERAESGAADVARDAPRFVPAARVADVLREVVGDPFAENVVALPCPRCGSRAHCPCRWLTPTAVVMAQAAYDGGDFAVLPILADCLEDAGCGVADLLAHLRRECEPGMGVCSLHRHVRGCWALDLVLGKE